MSSSNVVFLLCACAAAGFMVPLTGHAQAGAAKGAAPATAPASAAAPPARASDTIGEAADRQRTMRMLQSQSKAAVVPGAAPGADAKVPAIVVERAPEKALAPGAQGGRPAEPQMILTEVMRGPTKLLAGIELNGVNRFVSVGEDVGNGWRVASIDKYRVTLTTPEPAPEKAADRAADKASRAKAGNAKPEEARLKTMVLPLGMRTVTAQPRN